MLEAAPYLITFVLPCRSEALIEQACWVLGNIAADGPELRTVLQVPGSRNSEPILGPISVGMPDG